MSYKYTQKAREWHKRHYQENKEELNKKSRLYYQEHKEEISKQHSIYKKNHKEEIKEYRKKYRQLPEVKKKRNEQTKQYKRQHPDKIKAQNYALHNDQGGDYCELCNFYKIMGNQYGIYFKPFLGNESDLEFHHTNYIKNEGITLCMNHHIELHNNLGVEAI